MNILSMLASSLAAPHDLWTIIINWIQSGVANYGWTILLFTLLVKVVVSPLDFTVKLTTRKQNLVQKKCAPEIAKLNKKYGNDQQSIKVQTNSLYKREGMKMGVGCIVMLVNLVLTVVIFFTLYGSLRQVSAYESIVQYEQVEQSYTNAYYQGMIDFSDSDEIKNIEDAKECETKFAQAKAFIENEKNDTSSDEWTNHNEYYENHKAIFASTEITNKALVAAVSTWNNVKAKWLWIENIWVADSTTSPLPNYDGLMAIAKNGGDEYANYVSKNIDKERCNLISTNVMAEVKTQTGRSANGFYIIAILSAVVTLASQLISQFQNRLKNKKANELAKATDKSAGMSMKMMMIIMPIIMLIFALTTGAGFGIYIVTSNIASIVLGEISTLIVNAITKKKRLEVEAYLEKEANRLIKKGHMKG